MNSPPIVKSHVRDKGVYALRMRLTVSVSDKDIGENRSVSTDFTTALHSPTKLKPVAGMAESSVIVQSVKFYYVFTL